MFKLNSLSIRNFLSYGNKETFFDFTDRKSLSLVGVNGSGKSVIPMAIHYAIFGEAIDDRNLDDLVNRHNKKGTLISIEFENNAKAPIVNIQVIDIVITIINCGIFSFIFLPILLQNL